MSDFYRFIGSINTVYLAIGLVLVLAPIIVLTFTTKPKPPERPKFGRQRRSSDGGYVPHDHGNGNGSSNGGGGD